MSISIVGPMNRRLRRLVVASVILALAGCDDDTTEPGIEFDAAPILEQEGTAVITATYLDLDEAAADLIDAVEALSATTNAANLTAARDAWRATRVPWEASESFLFGPVDTEGLDPALDSWPVNEVDLENVLNSGETLTKEFVDGLEDTSKGFHTIEYLLFGVNGSKVAGDLTARELEYLVAATQSLKGATEALADAWSPSGGDYASVLRDAGEGSTVYPSQRAALQELINGMIVIADEVANGKINDPLSQQDVLPVESRFSGNSLSDFTNNLRSLQHIYTGDYENSGPGITDFVTELDPDLDERLTDEIAAAIAALQAVPEPFRDAIFDATDDVEAAQEAIRTVLQTLEEDVAPLLDMLQ